MRMVLIQIMMFCLLCLIFKMHYIYFGILLDFFFLTVDYS